MSPILKVLFFTVLLIINSLKLSAQDQESGLLKDYLNQLESKHQIIFLYDSDLLKDVKINLDITNLSLDETLNKLSEKTAFSFEKTDANVIVKPKNAGCNLRVCGTVTDEKTKETLPLVSIFSGTKGIYADENGNFTFYANLSDTAKIHFYIMGYDEKKLSGDFFNGKECQTIKLKPNILELSEVTITAYLSTGINYRMKDNTIEVNPNGMGLLPGQTDADILMAIDALPGINTPDSKAGNLNIRGGTPDQTLITFDNIPIYHKGHYFGTMSPYNASIIENVKVQRSAYMADKGGRVGGAIEINSKTKIADSTMGGIGLSTTYASAYTHIPLIKNKMSILVGGRTSYPSSWISPKLEAINDFIYQESIVKAAEIDPNLNLTNRNYHFNDFNAKLITKPGKNNDVTVSFLRISNTFKLEVADEKAHSDNYDEIKLNNIGGDIGWSRKWTSKISTKLNGTYSQYLQNFTSKTIVRPDTITKDAVFTNQLNDLDLKLVTDAVISKRSLLNFGYDLHYQNQEYVNSTFIKGKIPVNINTIIPAWLNSAFTTYNLTNPDKYIINIGLRANYYSPTKALYLEPRFMANYFLNNHFTLKSSAGIFNQFALQIYGIAIQSVGRIDNLLWLLADGDKVPVLNSKQAMFGSIYQKKSWVFDVEMYYKTTDGIAISNIVNPKSPNPYLYGSSKTIGADFLLKKNWKKLDTWISYTLAKSTLQFDSIQSDPFLHVFDQQHVLDIVAIYKIKQWSFSAGWKYRSGLAALPTIRARYLQGLQPPSSGPALPPPPASNTYLPGSAERYTDRFPDFHQLDISIVYALPKNKKQWNSSLGLSFLNVYDRKNIIDQHNRRMPTGNMWVSRFSLGFSPNLMITVNW